MPTYQPYPIIIFACETTNQVEVALFHWSNFSSMPLSLHEIPRKSSMHNLIQDRILVKEQVHKVTSFNVVSQHIHIILYLL